MDSFSKNTAITFITQILNLVLGIMTSIIIARILGPEGKGIYTLAILLPWFVIVISNLGIGPATVFYMGKGKYSLRKILGSNLILANILSVIAVIINIIIIVFFRNVLLKEVHLSYLLLATVLIPFLLLYEYLLNIILGLQEIKKYNLAESFKGFFFLVLLVMVLYVFKFGLIGAISSLIISTLLALTIIFLWVGKLANGLTYKIDKDCTRDLFLYGIKAHIGRLLSFLNYRFDIFLINAFLNPIAVGYYSVSVAIVEKLCLLSASASVVLFPRIASEKDEKRRKEFTPIVSRNVLFVTMMGAIFVYFISRWGVMLLYSKVYLPSVCPLQILLPGIIALSVARVLSNDIAGRGRPILTTYMAAVSVAVNIGLNILWIPRFGIEGAALASTVSYNILLIEVLFIYSRISGNPIAKILFIQRADFTFYKRFVFSATRRLGSFLQSNKG
jgi:O-antigen/teichoic acid export membrane protein